MQKLPVFIDHRLIKSLTINTFIFEQFIESMRRCVDESMVNDLPIPGLFCSLQRLVKYRQQLIIFID